MNSSEYISEIWKYVLPLFILAAVALVLVVVGWYNRRNKVGVSYFLLMVTMTMWLVFYGAGLLVFSESAYVVLSTMEYFTIVALPFFWLIHSMRYAEVPGWNAPGMMIILLATPLLLFTLAATQSAPNLLVNHHGFLSYTPPKIWTTERLAWNFVHIAYSLIYFGFGTYLVIRQINRNPKMAVKESVLLSMGVLVPWIGNITFIFRVTPLEKLDLAPFAFVLSGTLLAWGFFYKRFLNIVVIAHQALLDRMTEGLIVLDMNNWVVDLNPAAQNIFRVTPAKVINLPAENLMRPYPDLLNNIRFQNRKHQEISLIRGEQQLYFDLTINSLFDGRGQPIGKMVILHDITALKVTELKLKEAKVRAEQADNLKSAFLANMSHEIRTPMNAIIGFTNLLNDPDISDDERNEFTQHIRNSGNSLLRLIDDIIDISKLDANQITFNTDELVLKRFMTELYSYYNEFKTEIAKEHLQLSLKIPPEHQDLVIITDGIRLRQIMRHLLDNAVKFTNEGFVEFGFEMTESRIIRFFVKDTGIGIALEKQGLIFERFGRVMTGTRQEYGGTGLGLALSKGLIEKQGGRIWVESVLGQGAMFYFTLPVRLAAYKAPDTTQWSEMEKILKPEWPISADKFELKVPPVKPTDIPMREVPSESTPETVSAKAQDLEELSLPSDFPTTPGLIFDPQDFPIEAQTAQTVTHQPSILVIMEDQMTYLFIEMVLRPKKYHLVWARNLRESDAYLSGKNPSDLVILDVSQTADMTRQAVSEIRRNLMNRKVLAIIPFEGSSLGARARESGCDDLISKPIKPAQLIQLIERLLG